MMNDHEDLREQFYRAMKKDDYEHIVDEARKWGAFVGVLSTSVFWIIVLALLSMGH
jgi:hypothetical protein